jgi:hypothetical protein
MDDKGGGDNPTPFSLATVSLANEPYPSFTPAHREMLFAMKKPKSEHGPMHRDVALVAAGLVKQSDDSTRQIPLPPELITAISKKLRSVFSTSSAQSTGEAHLRLGASRNGGRTLVGTDKAASDAVTASRGSADVPPACDICHTPCKMYALCNFCRQGPVMHHGRCCWWNPGRWQKGGDAQVASDSAETRTESSRDVHKLRNRCLLIDSQDVHRLHPLVATKGSHHYPNSSRPGMDKFGPLGTSLLYADYLLEKTANPRADVSPNGLAWMLDRDELTRGRILTLAKDGVTMGEAIEAAIQSKVDLAMNNATTRATEINPKKRDATVITSTGQPARPERRQKGRITGSTFYPGIYPTYLGGPVATTIAAHMRAQSPATLVPGRIWNTIEAEFPELQTHSLQCFCILQGRGIEALEQPPFWAGHRDRATLRAPVGRHRASADSRAGPDRLLPAKLVPRFTFPDAATDDDFLRAAKVIAIFGHYLRAWREDQWKFLNQARAIILPISGLISDLLPVSIPRVAATECIRVSSILSTFSRQWPTNTAFEVAISRWPDMALANHYTHGIGIKDNSESSGISWPPQEGPRHSDSNAVFFGTIMASQQPREACEFWATILKTATKGPILRPSSRTRPDMKYGIGNWRLMPTFLVRQSCVKAHFIDDSEAGGKYSFTRMSEETCAASANFCSVRHAVLHAILRRLACVNALPDWVRLELALPGVPDTYNGTPCKPAYLPENISAALDTKGRVHFGEHKGLGLSLTSAGVGLCRLAAICTAISQFVFAIASADHVDDSPTIDTCEAHGFEHASTNTVHGFTGADCHAEATIPMERQRVLLRIAATTAAAHENVIENATAAITSRCPSHRTTSSLREKAYWRSTDSQCLLSRFPLWQLQAQTDYSLRCTRVVGPAPRPLIVYSNASWEPAPDANGVAHSPRLQPALEADFPLAWQKDWRTIKSALGNGDNSSLLVVEVPDTPWGWAYQTCPPWSPLSTGGQPRRLSSLVWRSFVRKDLENIVRLLTSVHICQLRRRTGHGQRSGLRRYHQDRTWHTALQEALTEHRS